MKPLLVAFGLLLSLPLTAAAEQQKDIFGRAVPDGRGRVTLVLYANKKTQDSITDPMNELSFRLRDTPILVLVRIDLRGVPSLFEGVARGIMRSAYTDGLDGYRKKFRNAGLVPPKDDEQGLFFIADSYGKTHEALGLPSGFTEAMIVAYDPAGREVVRMKFPRQMADAEVAIRRALAQK